MTLFKGFFFIALLVLVIATAMVTKNKWATIGISVYALVLAFATVHAYTFFSE